MCGTLVSKRTVSSAGSCPPIRLACLPAGSAAGNQASLPGHADPRDLSLSTPHAWHCRHARVRCVTVRPGHEALPKYNWPRGRASKYAMPTACGSATCSGQSNAALRRRPWRTRIADSALARPPARLGRPKPGRRRADGSTGAERADSGMIRTGASTMFPPQGGTAKSQPAGNGSAAAQMWWGGWGSNPRPADYESAALTC